MIASVRIYDGAKINPETDLKRTVILENVVSVNIAGNNDIYRITRANGDAHEFATATTNILIE